VFLHEGLIDDAIAAVEPRATHTLVERVVDAAMQSHPAWVIKVCRQQAEPFMDEGKAQASLKISARFQSQGLWSQSQQLWS
jgi:uncharacterized Zn finger protein